MILQDDFKAKLHDENSLLLDLIDTSLVFKRETANTLDIITGPDEDLDTLLFKTVGADLTVQNADLNDYKSTNSTRIQLVNDNSEFGLFGLLVRPQRCFAIFH